MCDEQTIKEIEALRVALDDFSAKKVSTRFDSVPGLCSLLYLVQKY